MMNSVNRIILSLALIVVSQMLNAKAIESGFDQQRPTDMGDKKWASLKSVVEEVQLLPSAGGGDEHLFGSSVSIDGNRMAIGSTGYSLNSIVHGGVYVFDFNGSKWLETQLLSPFDGLFNDKFGVSVSLSGNNLLVGANLDDDSGADSGTVFAYRFDGVSWLFLEKLTVNDASAGQIFGNAISISGNRALIGANADNENGISSGAAYIFDFDGTSWVQSQKLTAIDGNNLNRFGYSVSLSGNRALIGSIGDDDNGSNSGSAYIFDFDGNNWTQTT